MDAGYNGKDKGKDWVEKTLGWTAQKIVKRPRRWVRVPKDEEPPPYPAGFIVLPRRWVGGAKFLVAGPEQEDEQRLREAAGELGGVHLRGDDAPDGEAVGPLVRLFGRFLSWTLAITPHSKPYRSTVR